MAVIVIIATTIIVATSVRWGPVATDVGRVVGERVAKESGGSVVHIEMSNKKAQTTRTTKGQLEAPVAQLKGWKQISEFMAQPPAVVQRWAGEGMPVRKEGRNVTAMPDELSRWLGRESGSKQSVHIATDDADLSGDLKRGLAEVKGQRGSGKRNREK